MIPRQQQRSKIWARQRSIHGQHMFGGLFVARCFLSGVVPVGKMPLERHKTHLSHLSILDMLEGVPFVVAKRPHAFNHKN